jgi:hypothetical protein
MSIKSSLKQCRLAIEEAKALAATAHHADAFNKLLGAVDWLRDAVERVDREKENDS